MEKSEEINLDYEAHKIVEMQLIIQGEFFSATRKFGAFPSAHHGIATIREEFEECWDAIKANDISQARKEAVQVGAMALRFLIDIKEPEQADSVDK